LKSSKTLQAANQSRNAKTQADPAQTDRSRGFGFITMRSVEDAGRCIEKLNGMMLHGRAIRVDYSATQKAHAPTPGEYKGEKRPLGRSLSLIAPKPAFIR
jgi:RNA recognition motif-containing protein